MTDHTAPAVLKLPTILSDVHGALLNNYIVNVPLATPMMTYKENGADVHMITDGDTKLAEEFALILKHNIQNCAVTFTSLISRNTLIPDSSYGCEKTNPLYWQKLPDHLERDPQYCIVLDDQENIGKLAAEQGFHFVNTKITPTRDEDDVAADFITVYNRVVETLNL